MPLLSACEQKVYMVKFDTEGGNAIAANEIAKGNSVNKPENPTKLGYDFINWTYEGEEWNFDNNKVIKDITLKANYSLHNYSVTFKNSDGAVLETQDELHYGDVVTYKGSEPVAPRQEIRYTYTFSGWDKELKVTGDMVFTATYEVKGKKYHILYQDKYNLMADYELYTNNEEDIKGYPYSLPRDAVRNGVMYHFLDWEKVSFGENEHVYTAKYDRYSVDLTYNKDTVTGYTGTGAEIVIPSEHDGFAIRTIGPNAFKDCNFITSVDVPNTVTDIFNSVFENCTSLKSIEFKEGLHFIENDAFKGCSSLENAILPNSMINLPKRLVTDCASIKLNEYSNGLYLGNNSNPYLALISVKDKSVKQFTAHDNCEIIAGEIFSECTDLEDIIIPNGVRSIGQDAFKGLNKVKYNESNNALYLGNSSNKYVALIKAKNTNITEVNVESGCNLIHDEAFAYCSKLVTVTLPNTLKNIAFSAFANCSSLQAIDIPTSVKFVGAFTFMGCTSLKDVTLHEGTLYLEPNIFCNCKNLESLVVPNSVIYLGFNAFQGCLKLKSVTLSPNISEILYSTFTSCKALENIFIPEGVFAIGNQAFAQCTSLKVINIPHSLKEIADQAFLGCSVLEKISFNGSVEEWGAVVKGTNWDRSTGNYVMDYKAN